jgi:mannose-6-phosphate isomerase
VVVDEQYFRVERWAGDSAGLNAAAQAEDGPQMLFVAGGTLRIEGEGFAPFTLSRCELAVIPASVVRWEARGEAEVMRIVPQGGASRA